MKLPARLRRDRNRDQPTAGLEPLRAIRALESSEESPSMEVMTDNEIARWGKGTSMPLPASYAPDDADVLRTLFGVDVDDGDVLWSPDGGVGPQTMRQAPEAVRGEPST